MQRKPTDKPSMIPSALSLGITPIAEEPRWLPLPRMLHGIAVFPFVPAAHTQYTLLEPAYEHAGSQQVPAVGELCQPILLPNPHTNHPAARYQLPLEAGDHVFAFERQDAWLRGYVVAPFPLNATPRLGIFPLSHVAFRDSLAKGEDTWKRMTTEEQDTLLVGIATPAISEESSPVMQESDQQSMPESGTGLAVEARLTASDDELPSPTPPVSDTSRGSGNTLGRSVTMNDNSMRAKVVRRVRSQSLLVRGTQRTHPSLPLVPGIPRSGDTMPATTSSRREPLVDVTADVLREWCALLHTYLREQRYGLFSVMRDLIFELLNGRRQLIAQALPQDGLSRLRTHLVQLIAHGNKLQGLDQIARDSNGIVVGNEGQAVELYREHLRLTCSDLGQLSSKSGSGKTAAATASAAAAASSHEAVSAHAAVNTSHQPSSGHGTSASGNVAAVTSPGPSGHGPVVRTTRRTTAWDMPAETQAFLHLSLELNAFVASVCSAGEHVELYFWLYDYRSDRQLTENFICELTENGVAADHSKIGRLRTVFVELSERELTEEDDLYVVCRVVRRGRMQLGMATSSSGGRFGGSGSKDGLLHLDAHGSTSVSSTQSATASVNSQGESRYVNDIRRPVGVAVLPLRDVLRGQDIERNATMLGEHTMSIYIATSELGFAELHRSIIASQASDYTRTPNAEAVCITLRLFRGDTNSVFREHPNWLLDAARSLRLGFPDVVAPGMSRNHLYIRLAGGEFVQTLKRQMRSVECRVEVRSNTDGHCLAGVISRASGDRLRSNYSSLVLHHCNAPVWEEAFRLDVPVGQFEDAHLFFIFRHVNTMTGDQKDAVSTEDAKNFAFGVLPLVGSDGCALKDGERQLTLFKWDPRIVRPVVYLRCLIAPITGTEMSSALGGGPTPPQASTATLFAASSHHESLYAASLTADNGPHPQPLKDTFVMRSLLCSTRYSQSPALINLLRWKQLVRNRRSDLTTILHQFAFVDEMEVVKFLQDVFDALCEILGCTWYRDLHAADSARQVTTQAVTAIIRVLSIVNDRRFNNFQPVVSVYLARHMRSEEAWRDLLGTLRRFVDDPCNPDLAVTFRSALKVWSELIGFAMRSRAIQRTTAIERNDPPEEQQRREEEFLAELRGLFDELTRLMRVSEPQSVIGAQTIAARCVHRVFGPELIGCLGALEVAEIASRFIDAAGRRQLGTGGLRLRAIADVLDGPLMDSNMSRPIIASSVIRWLSECMELPEDQQRIRNGKWREQTHPALTVLVRLASRLRETSLHPRLMAADASLLTAYQQTERYSLRDAVTAVLTILPRMTVLFEQFINMEVPNTVPVASKISVFDSTLSDVIGDATLDLSAVPPSVISGVAELSIATLSVFELPTTDQLSDYLRSLLHIDGDEGAVTFLMRMFEMLEAMLTDTVFPRGWFNASLVVCRDSLRILRPIGELMIEAFVPDPHCADQFRQPLWGAFFRVLLRLLSCTKLQKDRLTAQQAAVVREIASDMMLKDGADLLRETWSAIGWEQNGQRTGGYQVRFTQRILSSVLDLSLSRCQVLRECAAHILFSICYSEHAIYGNLKRTEVECMDRLDKLAVWLRPGVEETRQMFINHMRRIFNAPDIPTALAQQAEEFMGNVSRFLELLFHVRSLPSGDEFEDERIVGTLKLLRFVKNIDQDEIYVKYVHQLVGVQTRNQNLVEAGLTLKLHADLLDWSLTRRVDAIAALQLPAQSAFERKEQLYLQILEYFNAGQAWELAVELCRELAHHYEHTVFDYPRLSDLLQQQATLHRNIVEKERYFSEYFRVGFYGKGFPSGLRGRQYIYRGIEWEKISAFCERIQNKYPAARLLHTSAPPDDQILSSDYQYIQITRVQPEPDRTRPVFVAGDIVHAAIRSYYEHNDVMTFSFTRPFKRASFIAPAATQGSTNLAVAGSAMGTVLVTPPTPTALTDQQQATLMTPVPGGLADATASGETQTSNEFLELWTEKTVLVTEHPFPSMLRRAEVVHTSISELCPIENAVVAMRAKNRELQALEKKYQVFVGTGRVSCNPFTMSLNGAVNAPVNGGVKLYKQAFLKNPQYLINNPDMTSHVRELDNAVLEQADIISRCLDIHGRIVPTEMMPLHQNLLHFFSINFADEIERRQGRRSISYVRPPNPSPIPPQPHARASYADLAMLTSPRMSIDVAGDGGSNFTAVDHLGTYYGHDMASRSLTSSSSVRRTASTHPTQSPPTSEPAQVPVTSSTGGRLSNAWHRLSSSSAGSRDSVELSEGAVVSPDIQQQQQQQQQLQPPSRKSVSRRWTLRRKKQQPII